jgi:hypothetical protein
MDEETEIERLTRERREAWVEADGLREDLFVLEEEAAYMENALRDIRRTLERDPSVFTLSSALATLGWIVGRVSPFIPESDRH